MVLILVLIAYLFKSKQFLDFNLEIQLAFLMRFPSIVSYKEQINQYELQKESHQYVFHLFHEPFRHQI